LTTTRFIFSADLIKTSALSLTTNNTFLLSNFSVTSILLIAFVVGFVKVILSSNKTIALSFNFKLIAEIKAILLILVLTFNL
jgi:hypothetical protein